MSCSVAKSGIVLGRVTPFIGIQGWLSLKLWMTMLGHGRTGLAALAERRVVTATRFAGLVDAPPRPARIDNPDLAALAFAYLPVGVAADDSAITHVNALNVAIHDRIIDQGRWHLHQFTVPDDLGRLRRGAIPRPMRFMANNPKVTEDHMRAVLTYLDDLAAEVEGTRQ